MQYVYKALPRYKSNMCKKQILSKIKSEEIDNIAGDFVLHQYWIPF